MKRATVCLVFAASTFLLADAFAAERQRRDADKSAEPDALAERVFLCAYFAGEVGSGHPAREREIGEKMEKLDCDDELIHRQIAAARKKYAGQPDKLAKLDRAIEEAKSEYGVEY